MHVLGEIVERLGGVAARPQVTTTRMSHNMQDAAALTKLQCTAFMDEEVPRLRQKAVVTRHLLPVLLRMTEVHFPPRDDHDRRVYLCLRCLCFMRVALQLLEEAIAVKSAGTAPQALRTPLSRSVSSWMAVAAPKPKHHAIHHVSDQTGTLRSSGFTVTSLRFGCACNVAETVHVSVFPRALKQKFLA